MGGGQGTFWQKKKGLIRCDVHQAGSEEDSVVAYCLSLTLLSCQEGGPTSQCRCGHLLGSFIFFLSEELQDPAQRQEGRGWESIKGLLQDTP